MRIGFATEGSGGLDAPVSTRFGRCETFTIVEVGGNGEIRNVKVVRNPGASAASGAGVKAAQKLIDEGVDVAVGGNIGPNSMAVLSEVGIKVVTVSGQNKTVKEALREVLSSL